MKRRPEWADYFEAERRKVLVAEYHLGMLRGAVANVKRQDESRPPVPIPVQAHFEGVAFSFIAACDQTAEGLNRALGFSLRHANLDIGLREAGQGSVDLLRNWWSAPIVRDVWSIRVLAVHHHYVKSRVGDQLEVQRPAERAEYSGSRDLVTYCEAVVEHAKRLPRVLARISGVNTSGMQADLQLE